MRQRTYEHHEEWNGKKKMKARKNIYLYRSETHSAQSLEWMNQFYFEINMFFCLLVYFFFCTLVAAIFSRWLFTFLFSKTIFIEYEGGFCQRLIWPEKKRKKEAKRSTIINANKVGECYECYFVCIAWENIFNLACGKRQIQPNYHTAMHFVVFILSTLIPKCEKVALEDVLCFLINMKMHQTNLKLELPESEIVKRLWLKGNRKRDKNDPKLNDAEQTNLP